MKFQNRACILLLLATVFALCLMAVTSCSPKTISKVTNTAEKKDSTYTRTEINKDSIYYIEKFEEKTVPEASVGITLTKKQMDSLIMALSTIPSSLSRTVYYQDPKLRATLAIMLDSLDRFQIRCTASELQYLEKEINQGKVIEKLKEELNAVNKSSTQFESEVKENRPSFWQRFKNLGMTLFFIIILVAAIWLFSIFKPW